MINYLLPEVKVIYTTRREEQKGKQVIAFCHILAMNFLECVPFGNTCGAPSGERTLATLTFRSGLVVGSRPALASEVRDLAHDTDLNDEEC